ncbi:hypothetical protein ElyMa_003789000 [Elysia marginata]|uniref:Uncharacterized protein n=1 Tax=Elysia marginata TaxID=1093978 RepID=A0AAV4FDU2_9GAST|nr:hypothetical protein ElyMa_003789000 [Elysia marginata]
MRERERERHSSRLKCTDDAAQRIQQRQKSASSTSLGVLFDNCLKNLPSSRQGAGSLRLLISSKERFVYR